VSLLSFACGVSPVTLIPQEIVRLPLQSTFCELNLVLTPNIKNHAPLVEEINIDREEHGKKPFPPQNKEETKEIKVSTTDPKSGMSKRNVRNYLLIHSIQRVIRVDLLQSKG
jgi:hypothetical protein